MDGWIARASAHNIKPIYTKCAMKLINLTCYWKLFDGNIHQAKNSIDIATFGVLRNKTFIQYGPCHFHSTIYCYQQHFRSSIIKKKLVETEKNWKNFNEYFAFCWTKPIMRNRGEKRKKKRNLKTGTPRVEFRPYLF